MKIEIERQKMSLDFSYSNNLIAKTFFIIN